MVTSTSAGVSGRINPNGQETTGWFQYGRSTRYGAHTPGRVVATGRRPRTIAAALAKLAPTTTYHYRVVASHCRGCRSGTSFGRDGTFTTVGYVNPVLANDGADPSVLVGERPTDYWAFTTGDRFGILHSTDLVHWTRVGRALTVRPKWVVPSGDWHPWAPHVARSSSACPGTTSPDR